MQHVVVNMCEKFHKDQFRKTRRSLGNGKSNKNKKKNNNNVGSAWRAVSGSKSQHKTNNIIIFFVGDTSMVDVIA